MGVVAKHHLSHGESIKVRWIKSYSSIMMLDLVTFLTRKS